MEWLGIVVVGVDGDVLFVEDVGEVVGVDVVEVE